MLILRTAVRRSVVGAQTPVARLLNTSVSVRKEDESAKYMAGVPLPSEGPRSERDLIREQVDRESEPTPMSIVSDAPSK